MGSFYFAQLNIWAVLVSAAAYWVLGSLWFAVLFGKIWGNELEKHGVKIQQPTKGGMTAKLIQTFVSNLVVALAMSYLVFVTQSEVMIHAIKLGVTCGVGFSAATIGIAYVWEGKSLKLTLIDIGYPVLGILICSIIITLWK